MASRTSARVAVLAWLSVTASATAGRVADRGFPELTWVPSDVDAVLGFSRPDAAVEATWSRLRGALLFATGIGEAGSVVEAAVSSVDRGIVAAWRREGGSSVVAVLHGEPTLPESSGEATSYVHRGRTIRLVPPATAAVAVEPRLWILGDRSAVERCLDARAGTGAVVTDDEARASVLAAHQGASVWGFLGPRWLGFDSGAAGRPRDVRSALGRLRGSTLVADISRQVAFRLRARLADEDTAAVVEDALRSHVDTLRAEARDGAAPVREAMEGAVVDRNGADVELSIPLSPDALTALHRSETAKRLVMLRLRDAEREDWQRVADVVDHLGVKPGDRVADVGAGAGFFTVALARVVGEQGKVYAVEIDAKALARLRRRADEGRLTQIEVVEGAADDPRLPAGSLDAALIVNAYHEMPQHARMLERLAAALRAGGRLVLVEPFSAEMRREPRERQIEKHVIAPELVEDELRRAGFEVVTRVEDFTRTPDSQGSYWLIEALFTGGGDRDERRAGSVRDRPRTRGDSTDPVSTRRTQGVGGVFSLFSMPLTAVTFPASFMRQSSFTLSPGFTVLRDGSASASTGIVTSRGEGGPPDSFFTMTVTVIVLARASAATTSAGTSMVRGAGCVASGGT